MKLFIINKDGFGYGGGWSFLVCAESFGDAVEIVKKIDTESSDFWANFKAYDIYKDADLGEMSIGSVRRICYYE